MVVSISLTLILAVAVWALQRFFGLKLWQGAVCALFGFYLANTTAAPAVRTVLSAIVRALSGLV